MNGCESIDRTAATLAFQAHGTVALFRTEPTNDETEGIEAALQTDAGGTLCAT